MINFEPPLFDLPFFGMTHAAYEGPLEPISHQVSDDRHVELKFFHPPLHRQASAAPVQGDVFKEAGHE
jgi:hypothetical protein